MRPFGAGTTIWISTFSLARFRLQIRSVHQKFYSCVVVDACSSYMSWLVSVCTCLPSWFPLHPRILWIGCGPGWTASTFMAARLCLYHSVSTWILPPDTCGNGTQRRCIEGWWKWEHNGRVVLVAANPTLKLPLFLQNRRQRLANRLFGEVLYLQRKLIDASYFFRTLLRPCSHPALSSRKLRRACVSCLRSSSRLSAA